MKKRFYYILGEILFILTILLSINFFIDAYGIFGKNMKYQILEPNKNYIKTKYILKNKNKYDSFIFGSSRVGMIPTDKIQGYKFYNMTYSEGLPNEWLNTLKTFVESDIKIKMVMVGIDDISFKVDYKEHFNQPMRLPYQNLISYKEIFKNYLFVNPKNDYNLKTFKKIRKKSYNEDYINIYTSGTNITKESLKVDEEIEKNKEIHIKKENFLKTVYGNREFININENINIIQQIENICRENDIELIIIFNPLHATAYTRNNEKEYKKIKEKLISILNCDIYDFSNNNSIAKNNYYWYETSHFRSIVGEMILKVIFRDKVKEETKINIPDDFVCVVKNK